MAYRILSATRRLAAWVVVLFLFTCALRLLWTYSQNVRRLVDVDHESDSGRSPANARRGDSKSTPPPNSITRSSSAPHPVEKPPAKDVRPPVPPSSQAGTKRDTPEVEKLPLFRDLYAQEAWPEISRDGHVTPDQVPYTVHYIWCDQNQQFKFQHYLGVLSVIRLLQPLTIVFHYSDLPVPDGDWYNVWFWVSQLLVQNLMHTAPRGQ